MSGIVSTLYEGIQGLMSVSHPQRSILGIRGFIELQTSTIYGIGKHFTALKVWDQSLKYELVIYKRGFNSLCFSYMMKGTGLTEFQVGTPRP